MTQITFDEIRKGDRVRTTITKKSGTIIIYEGVVERLNRESSVSVDGYALATLSDTNIELLDRPEPELPRPEVGEHIWIDRYNKTTKESEYCVGVVAQNSGQGDLEPWITLGTWSERDGGTWLTDDHEVYVRAWGLVEQEEPTAYGFVGTLVAPDGTVYDVARDDNSMYDTFNTVTGEWDGLDWEELLELGTFTPREGN